jgi:hypothetical protein
MEWKQQAIIFTAVNSGVPKPAVVIMKRVMIWEGDDPSNFE